MDRTYDATMTANVTSTAGDATLSVSDPAGNATGRLVNGAFVHPVHHQPVDESSGGPAQPARPRGAASASLGDVTITPRTTPTDSSSARAGLVLAVVAAVALSGCGSTAAPNVEPTNAKAHPARVAPAHAAKRTALAALDTLAIKGRAPKTGYSREQFGGGWATVAGCDMRDRILRRDLTRTTYELGDTCAVQSGRLNDPYTAAAITFVRGGPSEVDIDHVVALSDAWQKGAQQWTPGKRVAFANDPLNLLSVDAHVNRAKGDGDAATWLPPNKRFRCDYVARQVGVKRKYNAWVTQAEHDAIERVLLTCPSEKLP